jgi:hypothetical protein
VSQQFVSHEASLKTWIEHAPNICWISVVAVERSIMIRNLEKFAQYVLHFMLVYFYFFLVTFFILTFLCRCLVLFAIISFLSFSFLYYSFVSCLSFLLRSYLFALLPRTAFDFISFIWPRFSKNFLEYTNRPVFAVLVCMLQLKYRWRILLQ